MRTYQCAVCGSIVTSSQLDWSDGDAVPCCPHCHTTDMLFDVQTSTKLPPPPAEISIN